MGYKIYNHISHFQVYQVFNDSNRILLQKIDPNGQAKLDWIKSRINLPAGNYRIQFENNHFVHGLSIGRIEEINFQCKEGTCWLIIQVNEQNDCLTSSIECEMYVLVRGMNSIIQQHKAEQHHCVEPSDVN